MSKLERWVDDYNIVYCRGQDSPFSYYGMDTQQKIIYLYNTKTEKQVLQLLYSAYLQYRR